MTLNQSHLAVGAILTIPSAMAAQSVEQERQSPPVDRALEAVRSHSVHPVDEKSFTIDRSLRKHGIADANDQDWRVRLLAVRDLIRAGEEAIPQMVAGLRDPDVQVRYVCATALGVQKAESAIDELERVLSKDADALARSQAAVALGQIESTGSLELLQDRMANDPSKNVRHQCELSVDQIRKRMGATDALRESFRTLDESRFETMAVGQPAPDFTLPDTEGTTWHLNESKGQWVALIWVFADWCPVCHGEFHELIEMREEFDEANVSVATIEAHDRYRCRVMVGKEVDPEYWFAKESYQELYTDRIWWPHLIDRAGAVGAMYGVDPMAFAVHAEYINRPATIIIDPEGIARFAYYGTFWGDRPSIKQTLEMIKTEEFAFEHSRRLREEPGS